MRAKIPPDKCSICPVCDLYKHCKHSPVLVPYDGKQPYKERIQLYRAYVYKCKWFIDSLIDFD